MRRIFLGSGWTRLGGLSSLYRHFFGVRFTSVPLGGGDWRGAAALVGMPSRYDGYADEVGLFPPLGRWIR